jgi:hypothetical protein
MTKINKKTFAHSAPKPRSAALKIAASAGVISLILAAATGTAFAAKPGGGGGGGGHPAGGGGGHPGGGGAPHIGGGAPGGGAPHFGGGGGAPHIGGGGAPHFSAPHFGGGGHPGGGGVPHFATHATQHFSGRAVPQFNAPHGHVAPNFASHAHGGSAARFAHTNHGIASHANTSNANTSNLNHANHANLNHAPLAPSTAHSLATTAAATHNLPAARQAAFHADPRAFASHRQQFASNAAFRPFWHRGWHPWHHLGWIGPVFWPYAYGDFFYYALWPDYYYDVDPFWAYGYGDIYSAVFSPYDYSEYVQGSSGSSRSIGSSGSSGSSRMATLTESMAQSCSDEAAEVTGWPIDQIQAAVQPTQEQSTLLDDLGNALVKASDEVKSHCPTSVAFTPTGRLDTMQQRLQALANAVNIVSPPLQKFYDSLSDEQKARFNNIAPSEDKRTAPAQNVPNPQAQCTANVMNWPGDQVDRVVRPDDAQRAKLDALQSAMTQSADMIKAACPSDVPATPPARLAAVGQRLNAMLQAVGTVRPALADFYGSLSDDQKARFNTMGKQLFAENSQ